MKKRGQEGCWGQGWSQRSFFDNALKGTICERNWYEGNNGALGAHESRPTNTHLHTHYTEPAPALLGFDESIDFWCQSHGGNDHANACIRSNLNILSLYFPVQYNLCRNFEWQMCAAAGKLPGQGGPTIRFAHAPGALEVNGGPHPLGSCNGYHPSGCGEHGYASSDIFYLEACVYAVVCSNGDEIFALKDGEDWHCRVSSTGFAMLKEWLLMS